MVSHGERPPSLNSRVFGGSCELLYLELNYIDYPFNDLPNDRAASCSPTCVQTKLFEHEQKESCWKEREDGMFHCRRTKLKVKRGHGGS